MIAKSNRETDSSVGGVTTLSNGCELQNTSLYHHYLMLGAPKEAVRSIIPLKTGISSTRALSCLIWLYFKPCTKRALTDSFNSEATSINRRVDYLFELGYLKEDKYYWLSSAMNGYCSAVRYSVNDKGVLALKKLLGALSAHSKK